MSDGKLRMVVWPSHIGVALEGATPPFSINEPHNGGYQRGQIMWEPRGLNDIVGRAIIPCPPGDYTHFVYFKHPTKPQACGVVKMEHLLRVTDSLMMLEVYPIVNSDLALQEMRG